MYLYHIQWPTPLGYMEALADDHYLYFLAFADHKFLTREQDRIKKIFQLTTLEIENHLLTKLKAELKAYFAGDRKEFEIPLRLLGTPFQQDVWHELQSIPYANTKSYRDLAQAIGQPKAYRAVARSNAANPIAIIIPCHRIIAHDGSLSGYAGGVQRKAWLLDLEKAHVKP